MTGKRAAAFETIAHGVHAFHQPQAARYASIAWSQLGNFLSRFGGSRSLQLECEAWDRSSRVGAMTIRSSSNS